MSRVERLFLNEILVSCRAMQYAANSDGVGMGKAAKTLRGDSMNARASGQSHADFAANFHALTGNSPFPWQTRLYEFFKKGIVPPACDISAGLGKTMVMVIWLIARTANCSLPPYTPARPARRYRGRCAKTTRRAEFPGQAGGYRRPCPSAYRKCARAWKAPWASPARPAVCWPDTC
jgi:hypothetical protein